jgi:hypothetical protein
LQVIDNESVSNFHEKCDRVVQAVSTRLGLPLSSTPFGKTVIKKKFRVLNFDFDAKFPVTYREFTVERT